MNLSIDSPANPRIKELVKLRDSPRRRKERGVFFVEGAEDLLALVGAGRKVEEIYYCPSSSNEAVTLEYLKEFAKDGVPIVNTSLKAQEKASYRSAGHDLIGVVKSWSLELHPNMIQGKGPLMVLDEIEKPGNLGAILRSVEAFGGAGVILSDPAVDFFNPNVVRSSRGLMGRVPVAIGSKDEVLAWLEKSHHEIWATSSRAKHELGIGRLPDSVAFVFGSEKIGLGEFWQNSVKKWIKIPMCGTASSLNLSVSVGCLLYECTRS